MYVNTTLNKPYISSYVYEFIKHDTPTPTHSINHKEEIAEYVDK